MVNYSFTQKLPIFISYIFKLWMTRPLIMCFDKCFHIIDRHQNIFIQGFLKDFILACVET
jgi:hypothetical protein